MNTEQRYNCDWQWKAEVLTQKKKKKKNSHKLLFQPHIPRDLLAVYTQASTVNPNLNAPVTTECNFKYYTKTTQCCLYY